MWLSPTVATMPASPPAPSAQDQPTRAELAAVDEEDMGTIDPFDLFSPRKVRFPFPWLATLFYWCVACACIEISHVVMMFLLLE